MAIRDWRYGLFKKRFRGPPPQLTIHEYEECLNLEALVTGCSFTTTALFLVKCLISALLIVIISKNTHIYLFEMREHNLLKLLLSDYCISSYSFHPWIVSAPLCTVTFGLCSFGFPNSKKNSFRGNYMRKYGIPT